MAVKPEVLKGMDIFEFLKRDAEGHRRDDGSGRV